MKLIMMMSLTVSSSLLYAHHPVMIMILIITQTILTCLILWIILPTAWFSFILFLIFIGGLMVLFIYITSLAANEMFNLSTNLSLNQMSFLFALSILIMSMTLFHSQPSLLNMELNKQFSSLFTNHTAIFTFMIMTYLLITLVVVVKISTKMSGPIRNMINKS